MANEVDVCEEIIDLDEIKKMKVADLRAKLTEFGLSSKGTKQQLVARLEEFYSGQDDEVGDEGLLDDEEDGQVEDEAEDVSLEQANGKAAKDGQEEEQKQEGKDASGNAVGTTATKTLTDAEKKALRAEKFGVVSMEAKKQARAERFGVTSDSSEAPFSKKPKMDDETLEKLKKRAERFGESVSSAIKKVEDDDKKLQRAKRFGPAVDDEKMKKRAERFGLP